MWNFLKGLCHFESSSTTGANQPHYSIDDSGIEVICEAQPSRKCPWSEVNEIAIITTDEGPYLDDVFYVIRTNHGEICLTNFQVEEMNLLSRFAELPGFDFEAVIKAMGSTSNAVFMCWQRT